MPSEKVCVDTQRIRHALHALHETRLKAPNPAAHAYCTRGGDLKETCSHHARRNTNRQRMLAVTVREGRRGENTVTTRWKGL